jgi:hypothetical protein
MSQVLVWVGRDLIKFAFSSGGVATNALVEYPQIREPTCDLSLPRKKRHSLMTILFTTPSL